MAKSFGKMAINHRLTGFVYIIFTFFVIPFILISYTNASQDRQELLYEVADIGNEDNYYKKIVVKEFDANHLNHWFIYDKLATKEAPSDMPGQVLEAYYKKNLMILENMVFKLGAPNECWSGSDKRGEYNICLRSSNASYSSGEISMDSLFQFEKQYADDSVAKVVYWVHPKEHIIIKTTQFNSEGELIYSEQLIRELSF